MKGRGVARWMVLRSSMEIIGRSKYNIVIASRRVPLLRSCMAINWLLPSERDLKSAH